MQSTSRKRRKKLNQIARIVYRDGPLCHYCNVIVTPEQRTKDHVIPRAMGGSTRVENLVLSCASCNHSKADRLFYCECDFCTTLYEDFINMRSALYYTSESNYEVV